MCKKIYQYITLSVSVSLLSACVGGPIDIGELTDTSPFEGEWGSGPTPCYYDEKYDAITYETIIIEGTSIVYSYDLHDEPDCSDQRIDEDNNLPTFFSVTFDATFGDNVENSLCTNAQEVDLKIASITEDGVTYNGIDAEEYQVSRKYGRTIISYQSICTSDDGEKLYLSDVSYDDDGNHLNSYSEETRSTSFNEDNFFIEN